MSDDGRTIRMMLVARLCALWASQMQEQFGVGWKKWQLLAFAFGGLLAVVVCFFLFHHQETPFEQAVNFVRTGKAAAALPILEELSHQQPENTALFPWLAQAYLTTERLGEGRTALDTALRCKLPPDHLVPVVLAYAAFYESRGDFEEAEKLFSSAQAACPGNALDSGKVQLYLRWAGYDSNQARLDKALEHLEAANILAANADEGLQRQVAHDLSACYRQLAALAILKQHNNDKAMKLLRHSLQVSDEPATRMELADLCVEQGKITEAIENYQQVTRTDLNNLEARHRLVDLLVQSKDYNAAREALLELIDKEKSLENYNLLAALNLRMKNYAGAVHALEDAIDLKANDPALLTQLEKALRNWSASLAGSGKVEESLSVKGHADRVAEMLALLKPKNVDKTLLPPNAAWDPSHPPIALSYSRIWLARGSLTPEGEIQIRNITGVPVTDLSLTVVFYDNTRKLRQGTVVLPVAGPASPPFASDSTRSLYFSCPSTVQADHQLAVKIYWKGHFLKELPVVKSRY